MADYDEYAETPAPISDETSGETPVLKMAGGEITIESYFIPDVGGAMAPPATTNTPEGE